MLYKEWRVIRFRFFLAIAAYTLSGIFALLGWMASYCSNQTTSEFSGCGWRNNGLGFNELWLIYAFFVTLGLALLFTADMIGEEQNRGTIGFLLSRPYSRVGIYSAKVFVRAIALLAAQLLIFVPTLLFSFLVLDSSDIIRDSAGNRISSNFAADVTLALILLIVGILFVCMGGLVSIFTTNALQSIIIDLIAASFLILTFYLLKINTNQFPLIIFDRTSAAENIIYLLVGGAIASGLFVVGRREFNVREY